jgi:hypothetical protein
MQQMQNSNTQQQQVAQHSHHAERRAALVAVQQTGNASRPLTKARSIVVTCTSITDPRCVLLCSDSAVVFSSNVLNCAGSGSRLCAAARGGHLTHHSMFMFLTMLCCVCPGILSLTALQGLAVGFVLLRVAGAYKSKSSRICLLHLSWLP